MSDTTTNTWPTPDRVKAVYTELRQAVHAVDELVRDYAGLEPVDDPVELREGVAPPAAEELAAVAFAAGQVKEEAEILDSFAGDLMAACRVAVTQAEL